jgi:hypothetical protein
MSKLRDWWRLQRVKRKLRRYPPHIQVILIELGLKRQRNGLKHNPHT